MKTKAIRLYDEKDLRMETFQLPQIKQDEICARIVSDSACMSTYKAVIKGSKHKRVPEDIGCNPIIVGHEFSGELVKVGDKWKDTFKAGDKFSIQPNINYKGIGYAPGYSFPYFGGIATYINIPNEVIEKGFLLEYSGDAFFKASLSEPMSCIVAAFKASYHTEDGGHIHNMGIKDGGNMAILAGVGPMGMGAVDYALHNTNKRPKTLVVTDIDEKRLERAKNIFTEEDAAKNGILLKYVNVSTTLNASQALIDITDGKGFDDVFAFAPVKPVLEMADQILGKDGCLNFFAGPTDPNFSAETNFYNVHYGATHIVGTSGGNTNDMIESLDLMALNLINPAVMITHVGGINSAIDTTLNLPNIPGGKKLIYNHINMDLTALEDFKKLGEKNLYFRSLAEIVEKHNGLWSAEAEEYLLRNFAN